MFFLSGLFFWRGFERKGLALFLRDRLLRLGLPLAVSLLLFSAVAYYPSYLQTTAHDGISGFLQQWKTLGFLPTGPAWFVGVLLLYDCVAALLFSTMPKAAAPLISIARRLGATPWLFYLVLVASSALAYVPMEIAFTPFRWSAFGPLVFQTSRIVHYFLYFAAGIGVGAAGLEDGLLATTGTLSRQWLAWLALAVFCFFALYTASHWLGAASLLLRAIVSGLLWVLSCAASSFAFLALFLRFARAQSDWADSLAQNSYGIYLDHYMFVSWIVYGATMFPAAPWLKFAVCLPLAIITSWAASWLIRRPALVARVV